MRHLERAAASEPVGALVFFHGYWGIPEDFVAFLDKVDQARRFHGYLPEGPHHMSEGRYSWFEGESYDLAPEVGEWLDTVPFEPSRLVLAGWSQGTTVAYILGVERRVAGVVALGGRLPDDVLFESPLPRFAIGHGTADESVPVESAREARDRLTAAGAEVVYRETAVGHEIGQEVVPELQRFLESLP